VLVDGTGEDVLQQLLLIWIMRFSSCC